MARWYYEIDGYQVESDGKMVTPDVIPGRIPEGGWHGVLVRAYDLDNPGVERHTRVYKPDNFHNWGEVHHVVDQHLQQYGVSLA